MTIEPTDEDIVQYAAAAKRAIRAGAARAWTPSTRTAFGLPPTGPLSAWERPDGEEFDILGEGGHPSRWFRSGPPPFGWAAPDDDTPPAPQYYAATGEVFHIVPPYSQSAEPA